MARVSRGDNKPKKTTNKGRKPTKAELDSQRFLARLHRGTGGRAGARTR